MSVIVFCGPTVDAATVRRIIPDAACLPPAAQGHLHAAARERPAAIALVDGVFLDLPSVWHKEILAALDAGVAVWGAASMGALRAAECADFGMIGVGKIVEAFREGRYPPFEDAFEDDDEVAVIHGPPELGSQALSDAMVDLRETLARSEAAGVIDATARDLLAARMKALPFPERRFGVLTDLAREGLDAEAADALARGLLRHRCSQKREDALALLDALATGAPAAPARDWIFERTLDWERFAAGCPAPRPTPEERAALSALAENPPLERRVRRRAAARLAALDLDIAGAEVADVLRAFRYDRALLSRAALDEWVERNLLSPGGFARLLRDEASLAALADRVDPDRLARAMLDELRLDGGLGEPRPRLEGRR